MTRRLALMLVVTATGAACSERTLSQDSAARLIANLEQFKREARITIRTDVPFQTAFKCQSQAEVERNPLNSFALHRGWVRLDARETVLGFGTKSTCPSLALTQSGDAASTGWTRGGAASSQGTTWAVPIGRREILAVTRLTLVPEGWTQVEFDWKWSPNDTGTTLHRSIPRADAFFSTRRNGRASCRQVASEWRCQLAMWTTPADAGEFDP